MDGVCKNLLLCNRQCTDFYLLLMPGNKPFQTLGGWSVRDDIADTEGMCTLEDMNIVPENPAYVYDNISDLIDFCLSIAG